jgi:hydrogenase maturation protease
LLENFGLSILNPQSSNAGSMDARGPEKKIDLLVIGYGNTLRSDDSVGRRVAEAIEGQTLPGVRALSVALLTPELAASIAKARRVVFVDASVEAASEIELRKVKPAKSSEILGHACNPGIVLSMARDLFGNIPEAWCLGIPAENLGIGEELSPLAKQGLEVAIEKIRQLAGCA